MTSRKKKTIVISAVFGVLFFLLLMSYLFADIPIDYDEIKSGITSVERDGRIEFEYWLTDPVAYIGGGISTPVVCDYDNGYSYHYYYITIRASRWNIWFHPCKTTIPDFILDQDGREIHYGKGLGEHYTKEEQMANPGLLSMRFFRAYYLNSDGSAVLIWEHPDAQSIIERTKTELQPPESYVIRRPKI